MIKNHKQFRLKILFVFSLMYALMMFFVWNINIPFILNNNGLVYDISNLFYLLLLIINVDSIFKEKKYRYIYPFLIVLLILNYNYKFIEFKFDGKFKTIYDISFFMIYIIGFSLLNKKEIILIFQSLLGLIFIYNILGIYGAVTKIDYFFGIIPNILTDNYRYSSILTNPNTLGNYSFLGVIISLYFLMKNNNFKTNIIYTITLFGSLLGILISMNRGSIIMVLLAFILLILNYKKLNDYVKHLLYGIIGLGLLAGLSLLIYDSTLFFKLFRITQGLTGRVELWSYALDNIVAKPFIGIGYNKSYVYFIELGGFDVGHPHNLYLALLMELGLISSIIILSFIIYVIIKSYLNIKYTNIFKNELVIIYTFLISFLVGSLFEFQFMKISSYNLIIFICFALFFNINRSIKNEGLYAKKVTHIITGLDSGGAESMLFKLVENRSDKFKYKIISMHDKGFYGEKIKSLGVEVVTLNMNSFKGIITFPFKLYYHLIGVDTVKTWLYHANFIGTFFVKLAFVPNLIWGLRQSDFSRENNSKSASIFAKLSKYISFLPNKIISNSDEVKRVHEDFGYYKKNMVVVYNGFSLDNFYSDEKLREEVRNELNIKEEIVFISVARFDIQKDHENLFKSLELTSIERPNFNFKLILLGIGMEKDNDQLEVLLKKYNLKEKTILLGVKRNVNDYLNASDIFILSSLAEGFPNVLGEAMATNTLVITTDVGDAKMIVGDFGFSVEKMNSEALKDKIIEVLDLDEDKKQYLRVNSRIRIEENFEIKTIARKYEQYY